MKKKICTLLAALMLFSAVAGCASKDAGSDSASDNTQNTQTAQKDDTQDTAAKSEAIAVVSREEGSGTRGAFVELFGIEQKDADGNKVDHTIATASQTNSTGVMLTTVSQNPSAIGYISLGALNKDVKAVKIDGVEASVENVNNGTYSVSRPFNIATGENVSEAAQDFIDYILSSDGQAIIEEAGYISASDAGAYSGPKASGSVVVAGSSSVSPVMEKLIEAYKTVNPDISIELQQSDSTTGMNSAIEGVCDIGMASRALKDEELQSLKATTIATDGIAVIVNLENSVDSLTTEQVMKIYTGEITDWAEVK